MSAPDFTPQIPGEPLATMSPITPAVTGATGGTPETSESITAAQAPQYSAKHNGGGRWIVIDLNAPKVDGKDVKIGDFVGASKEEAEFEVSRLSAGGEPLALDPERLADKAALTTPAPAARAVDAATLKQPVMTPDGWLCPEPPAAKE